MIHFSSYKVKDNTKNFMKKKECLFPVFDKCHQTLKKKLWRVKNQKRKGVYQGIKKKVKLCSNIS